MNKMKWILCFCASLFLASFVSCGKKPVKLLLCGSGWNKIVIIDKETKQIEWTHELEDGEECNSVEYTPNGNILYSYSGGAKLITKDHKVLWDIPAPDGSEMQTATVMDDGNYLLASCGNPATILEVNRKGEVLSETKYDTGVDHPHAQFRQVRKNHRGNYIIPVFATSDLREVSPEGNLIKSVEVGGTPFTTLFLPNGNYLVSCGDGHYFAEVDFNRGEILYKKDNVEGIPLSLVAGLLLSENDNLYIANWQGHNKDAEGQPQLVELDKNNRIVWSLNDNGTFKFVSAVSLAE